MTKKGSNIIEEIKKNDRILHYHYIQENIKHVTPSVSKRLVSEYFFTQEKQKKSPKFAEFHNL